MKNILELFRLHKYQDIIKLSDDYLDKSVSDNYYIILSMVIENDIYRALSFINRSVVIKDNLDKISLGGANFNSIATLSLSSEGYPLAKLLFIYNFVNSVYKEELSNPIKDKQSYYYIRFNEMINDLFEAQGSIEIISELTNDSDLLLG